MTRSSSPSRPAVPSRPAGTTVSAGTTWFRRFHKAADGAPALLCFPHAGGAAGTYHRLSEVLAPEIDVVAVQYPGRLDRRHEPAHTDLRELADRIGELVRARASGAGPVPAFFGHSMGATVAFEVARGLDTQPPVLFAAGRRAPSRSTRQYVHPRPDEDILRDAERLGGMTAEQLASRALTRMVLPVLRADHEAIDTYEYAPGPPLECPIVVLAGDADPITPIDDALAWQAHGAAGSECHVLAGGHFFVDAHLDRIGRLVRARLT